MTNKRTAETTKRTAVIYQISKYIMLFLILKINNLPRNWSNVNLIYFKTLFRGTFGVLVNYKKPYTLHILKFFFMILGPSKGSILQKVDFVWLSVV